MEADEKSDRGTGAEPFLAVAMYLSLLSYV